MIMMIIIGEVETRDLNKECFDKDIYPSKILYCI